MKKFFKEFADFINKGNAFELAIGIIIGSCFTGIVNSLVNGIFYPLINLIPGKNGLSLLKIVLKEATENSDAIILDIGSVISAIITFILTALILFVLLKFFNRVKANHEKLEKQIKDKIEAKKIEKKNKEGKEEGEEK